MKTSYHRAGGSRNSRNAPPTSKIDALTGFTVALTRGGRHFKTKCPGWSPSLCNVAAELAGIGQVRHG